MYFDGLAAPVYEIPALVRTERDLAQTNGYFRLSGCGGSQKTHMAFVLGDGFSCKIIVFSAASQALSAYEELASLRDDVYLYEARDLLFYSADTKGRELERRRMRTVDAVAYGAAGVIVTWGEALLDMVAPMEAIVAKSCRICDTDTVDLTALADRLVCIGYERTDLVYDHGQFSIRGGIIDIFPIAADEPVRIELWDNTIDSMRLFDPKSQRSTENVTDVRIMPTQSWQDGFSRKCCFLDYFAPENTAVFIDEPDMLFEEIKAQLDEYNTSVKKRVEAGVSLRTDLDVCGKKEIVRSLNRFSGYIFTMLETPCGGLLVRESFLIETQGIMSYRGDFSLLTADLVKLTKQKYRILLFSPSRTRAERLAKDLREYGVSAYFFGGGPKETDDGSRTVAAAEKERCPLPGQVMVGCATLGSGYEYPMQKWMALSESDVFGRRQKKKKPRYFEGRGIQSFSMLHPGDYVVHEDHGLGIYAGIEKMEVDGIEKDYIRITYADNGVLYVPASQLSSVQKYAGIEEKQVRLNKLGTPAWTKTKQNVKKAVWKIAEDLVELYARRQETSGYVYGPDTVWQREFEEMFPFEETQDQLTAIEDTKRDMESQKVMDRLICGDVGYGKTEIAIRAAFKAVQEGKQVAYLAPTTILAQQHFNTFSQRMKDFPVVVDLLCRFRSPSAQKETIEKLGRGQVDIVIGTHRLLSKDVTYKDLGLLIIDEEQRFGVRHKERIKKLRENVDVLTLTATPIPRTLHMSLIGIRDMSVLEEAPQNRLPIQTYVLEYNPEIIREAIERELNRGGQVYYVYNRVTDIADVTAKIRELVPEAEVAYAHGQMNERELEKKMYAFMNREIDVLVSTTIIETGLDIGNANTMIIHDADRLGLSQLYQLRGRVGRQGRLAYAFMLYRRGGLLKEDAQKRLSAIREFTQLGSGFKIAMRDLEIRGAGNLLGEAQHGHMAAVGYDLYCKMLHEAVRRLKGQEKETDIFDTEIDVQVDASIPSSYIKNEQQRLDVYRQIARAGTEEEITDLTGELIDRFGDTPPKVIRLLQAASLRILAHSCYVTSLSQKGDVLRLVFYEKAPLDTKRLADLVSKDRSLSIAGGGDPSLVCHMAYGGRRVTAAKLLPFIRELLDKVLTCVTI